MGKPAWGNAHASPAESIGRRGEPGELKHLSTPRKRKDSLSSGERKGRSPNPYSLVARRPMLYGGCGARLGTRRQSQGVTKPALSGMVLERPAVEGESPVREKRPVSRRCPRVPRGTGNPVGSWVDHHPRLNTLGDR